MTKAADLGLKSVAVCTVHSNQKHFPQDTGAHIALRESYGGRRLLRISNGASLFSGTVRRFLEAHPDFRVVLCVERTDRSLYNALIPLYFPATATEEEAATWCLPTDIGGPLGEPNDPERQIRIIQNPHHEDAMNGGK